MKIIEFDSLNDVKTAYLRGNINVICSTLFEIAELSVKFSKKSKIILLSDYSDGADEILSLSVDSISQLKGKRIGLEMGTITEFLLRRALEKSGISFEEVEPVPMEQGEMKTSHHEDLVDAVISYPPVSVELKSDKSKNYKSIFSSKDIPYEIVDSVSINPDLIERYPDIQRKFWRVWGDVLSYLDSNEKLAVKFMADREGISEAEFRDALTGLKYFTEKEQNEVLNLKNKTLFHSLTLIKKMMEKSDKAYSSMNERDFLSDM